MSKRIFTKEEVAVLSKNKNVNKCSKKSITYAKDFKVKAVRLYNEGIPAKEIFEDAGFDICMLGRKKPNDCLKRWNKIYRTKGVKVLSEESRGRKGGRPKKIKDPTDKEKIERLELEVEYLKAENDFLAKLRAQKREL